jgi:hypothetical protein
MGALFGSQGFSIRALHSNAGAARWSSAGRWCLFECALTQAEAFFGTTEVVPFQPVS